MNKHELVRCVNKKGKVKHISFFRTNDVAWMERHSLIVQDDRVNLKKVEEIWKDTKSNSANQSPSPEAKKDVPNVESREPEEGETEVIIKIETIEDFNNSGTEVVKQPEVIKDESIKVEESVEPDFGIPELLELTVVKQKKRLSQLSPRGRRELLKLETRKGAIKNIKEYGD